MVWWKKTKPKTEREKWLDAWAAHPEMEDRAYNGVAIKDNPKLLKDIGEIRDRYFDLLQEMDRVRRDQTIAHRERNNGIENARFDMVGHSNASYNRLQKECGLTKDDAAALMGSVIRRTCLSFGKGTVYVPQEDLAKTPEELGWKRIVTQSDPLNDKGKVTR
jgi:hypothetical protein